MGGPAHTQSQSLHPSPPGTALQHRRKGEESGTAVPLPAKPQSNPVSTNLPHTPLHKPEVLKVQAKAQPARNSPILFSKRTGHKFLLPAVGAPPRAEPQLLLRTLPASSHTRLGLATKWR